jgi:hypothetical protein
MNMQHFLLEAISSTDEQIKKEANANLNAMRNYQFPIDTNTQITSSKIQNRVNDNEPVTFEWAVTNYNGYDKQFLLDLARSLISEMTDTSMFFENQSKRELAEYQRKFPVVAAMKGGPEIFDRFGSLVGVELVKIADTNFTRIYNEDGKPEFHKRDDDNGLRDIFGRYYLGLNEDLKRKYKSISGRIPDFGKYSDVVLYGAYLEHIFQFFQDARKQMSDSDGSMSPMEDMSTVFNHGAHNIAKKAVEDLPGTAKGSLTNWGSVYNEGKTVMKTIEPSRLTNDNLSDINVYPQYVVDVLKLVPETIKLLINILKSPKYNNKYDMVVQGLNQISSMGDSKVLVTTTKDLIKMLRDPEVISDCIQYNLGDIFKKWGQSWVNDMGESSLDEVLDSTVRIQNSDQKNARAVPVAVGPSLRRTNSSREYTGMDIIAQSNIGMTIGKAAVIKDLSLTKLEEEAKRRKERDGLTFDEWVAQIKTSGDKTNINKNINKALKRNKSDAETCVSFDTYDGVNHNFKVDDKIDERLAEGALKNVIARKSKVETNQFGDSRHGYFISIPHGFAFATMQSNDDKAIVVNENADTLCAGLMLNGRPFKYGSVSELMNSPIGKYCRAVAKYGKTGRIRFESRDANSAYGKVLGALKELKSSGQEFTVDLGANPFDTLRSVLENSLTDTTKIDETIDALKAKGLSMSVEKYDKNTGKFVFSRINSRYTVQMALTLLKHLNDMYHLDNTEEGYSDIDVLRILEAVAPGVWDLSRWNYSFVRKAEAALTDDDDVSEDTEIGGDDVYEDEFASIDDYWADDVDGVIEDNEEENENAVEGIGGEDSKTIHSVFDRVFDKLFPNPSDAKFDANDTRRLQNGIVNALEYIRKNGDLDINIEHSVKNIRFSNFKDFIRQFWDVVQSAIDNKPSLSDNSIRMSAFLDDDDELSHGGSMSVVKDILTAAMDTSDGPVDRKLVPSIGSLMVKYAIDDAVGKNGIENRFDQEYLVSSFNEHFGKDLKLKLDRLSELKEYHESNGEISDFDVNREIEEASRDAVLYQTIQDKLESEPDYVYRVADTVVKNSGKIIGAVNELPTDVSTTFVPFVSAAAKHYNSPGDSIIDFCLYRTEADNSTTNTKKLNKAFDDSRINTMMSKLLNSVPKECLSIDYGTDENGIAILDSKTAREILALELQNLESHYAKSPREQDFNVLYGKINDIYKNGTIRGLFTVENRNGTSSPYSFKGELIDLDKVNSFFTSLMELADTYNDIGYSNVKGRVTEKQIRSQQTMNNDKQTQKTLINKHFAKLKSGFDALYNAWRSNKPFSDDELTKLKTAMDKVMTQVVSNPMSVLVNNNAKLISAYAYHEAIVKANQRDVAPSGNGFGNDTDKGLNKENAVQGRSMPLDKSLSVLRLAERICQASDVKQRVKDIQKSGINSERAEDDYNAYLSESGDSQFAVRLLKSGSAEDIDAAKDDTSLFCNYEGSIPIRNNKDRDRVAKLRESELILLWYNAASAIMNSRQFGTYKETVSKIAAQSELLNNPNIELVPRALVDRFINVDAELQMANDKERMRMLGAGTKSNNNVVANAVNVMREVNRYPENRTGELIDRVISDKSLDNEDIKTLIYGMKKRGNADVGTDITLNGKLDVESIDVNDMIIKTNIKLKQGDSIIITGYGISSLRTVSTIVSSDDKKYNITTVNGLHAGDKDIKFKRFQARNEFSGVDMKFSSVVRKMLEWHDKYRDSASVPQDISDKVYFLKMLYDGCAGSDVVKCTISYCAWRILHYDNSIKPGKISFAGDTSRGKFVQKLVSIIVSDLKTFGPRGEKEDTVMYNEIIDMLPEGFNRIARDFGFNIDVESEDVRQKAKDIGQNVKTTSIDVNATDTLKRIVDIIGKGFGFVTDTNVKRVLKNQNLITKLNISKKDADKLLSMVNGTYKSVLDSVIKEHNWKIAKPLVEGYIRSLTAEDSPNLDDAIKYVKDNYDISKKDNSMEFAAYIKNNCANDIESIINRK